MAKRRCAYCGQREGHGHSVRCGVTRHGLDPCYEEDPADVTAERDRYREALLRVSRDRREPDKVFAQVSTAVGFDALVETGLVRPLVRDGDRSAYVEAPASNQEEENA